MKILTLDLMKQAAMIGHSRQDAFLGVVGDSLEEWVENTCAIKLHERNASKLLPAEYVDGGRRNLVPMYHPIVGVTSVVDREDSSVTDAENYRWNAWRIWKRDESNWRSGDQRWIVTYSAGYDQDDIPATLKLGMLMLCKRWYDNRPGASSGSAMGESVNWADYVDTDINQILSSHTFERPF